ncbi:MAG: transcription antitermination factor NusB [Eubacteriales bacterium]|nr:transcription antitermination factor NusB [Eubacteriales bacterium]
MGRKEAREIALHLVFEFGFQTFASEEIVASRLEQSVLDSLAGDIALYAGPMSDDQKKYIIATVVGVGEHLAELDESISKHSTNWNTNRLSRITVAILRLALYEMQYTEDVPVSAAINEAVELAKKYDSKESSAFINGVLGTVSREQAKD